MSILTDFREEFNSRNMNFTKCCFCNDRVFSQLAHIIPSGHTGTTSVNTILKKHSYLKRSEAILILDIPLLNVMPSCAECNGLGDSSKAKVCKTDDITILPNVFIDIALEVIEGLDEKIKEIAEIKLFISAIKYDKKFYTDKEVVEILKKLQHHFIKKFYDGIKDK